MQKPEIEALLKAAGAFYVSDWDDLHEMWATAWGATFMIPMAGPFGELDEQDVREIIEAISLSRP